MIAGTVQARVNNGSLVESALRAGMKVKRSETGRTDQRYVRAKGHDALRLQLVLEYGDVDGALTAKRHQMRLRY
jgi:hypothetical protein